MNKFYLVILMLTLSVSTKAQVNIGVEAGYVNSSLGKDSFSQSSYLVGAFVSHTKNKIVLESGLFYKRNEVTMENIKDPYAFLDEVEMEMNYLVLPLMVGYKADLGDKFCVIPKAGLFAAYGLNGDAVFSNKNHLERGEVFKTTEIFFKLANSQTIRALDRFNTGLKIALECKLSHFSINASYNYALLTQKYVGRNTRNSNWDLSLRYYIK